MTSPEVGKKKKEDSYKNNDSKLRLGNFKITDIVDYSCTIQVRDVQAKCTLFVQIRSVSK